MKEEIVEDKGGGKKAAKQRGKQTKTLQVDNYVIRTTCRELQEVMTKKVK